MKRGTKRNYFKADLPEVSEEHAKREVILGGLGFLIGLGAFLALRPHSGHWIELMVGVAVCATLTLGGMKLAAWIEHYTENKGE